MKRTIAIILALGLLLASGGMVLAATTVSITAAVSNSFSMGIYDSGGTSSLSSLAFNVQPGRATDPQVLTVKTNGSGSYQVTLASTSFTTPSDPGPVYTQAASVLQFQETGATTWKSASTTAQNMLASAGTASSSGDTKSFNLRMNFPVSANDGTYSGTVTITCLPQ